MITAQKENGSLVLTSPCQALTYQKGFTLMEVLLALCVMIILAGISIPIAWQFVMQNDLDVSANITAQTLRRAQGLAMSMKGDSVWGVNLEAQTITLFKGPSFNSREVAFDENFALSIPVSFMGLTEITFSKLFGEPNSNGQILMSNNLNQNRTIVINQKGVISY